MRAEARQKNEGPLLPQKFPDVIGVKRLEEVVIRCCFPRIGRVGSWRWSEVLVKYKDSFHRNGVMLEM